MSERVSDCVCPFGMHSVAAPGEGVLCEGVCGGEVSEWVRVCVSE